MMNSFIFHKYSKLNKWKIVIIIIFFVAVSISAKGLCSQKQPSSPLFYQNIDIPSGEYNIMVREGHISDGLRDEPNTITFDKLGDTQHSTIAEYKIDDAFLSSFLLKDNENIFITVWTTGVGYRLRSYLLSDNQVEEVLQVASYSPPGFMNLYGGKHAIIINTSDRESKSEDSYDIYVFTRNQYKHYKNIKITLLPAINSE